MKSQIIISGGIHGNYILKLACMTFDCEEHKYPFNGFKLVFNTMKEGRKTLEDAYETLKNEEPDFYKEGGINLYNDCLNYDDSRAVLSKFD